MAQGGRAVRETTVSEAGGAEATLSPLSPVTQLSLKPSRQDFIIKRVPQKATFPHMTQVL